MDAIMKYCTAIAWAASLVLVGSAPLLAQSPTALTSVADSYLQSGSPNQNNGADSFLRIQQSGDNRAIVQFSQTAIAGAVGSQGLAAAKLRFYISSNGNNWGATGALLESTG